jgi:hypothetical protein
MMRQPKGRRSETWQCLFLNVSKTKEMIVDYRKRRPEHTPIHIDGAVVEWFGMGPQILKKIYSCTIEGILTGCLVWKLLGMRS